MRTRCRTRPSSQSARLGESESAALALGARAPSGTARSCRPYRQYRWLIRRCTIAAAWREVTRSGTGRRGQQLLANSPNGTRRGLCPDRSNLLRAAGGRCDPRGRPVSPANRQRPPGRVLAIAGTVGHGVFEMIARGGRQPRGPTSSAHTASRRFQTPAGRPTAHGSRRLIRPGETARRDRRCSRCATEAPLWTGSPQMAPPSGRPVRDSLLQVRERAVLDSYHSAPAGRYRARPAPSYHTPGLR